MHKRAEAPQLPQLLFGIGCVQHTGDKFRLRLRGTSGPRAAPLEVWEHLPREPCRLCFRPRQHKEPGVGLAVLSCILSRRHSRELQWHDALWRSSHLPHSPTNTCSARNSHFCHCRNHVSMWENDPQDKEDCSIYRTIYKDNGIETQWSYFSDHFVIWNKKKAIFLIFI